MPRLRWSLVVGLVALVVFAPGASAKDRYKAKGHHKAGPATFRVTFSGEGGWRSTINSDTTHSNLHDVWSLAEESSFRWSWAQHGEYVGVPWPCKVGSLNLCSRLEAGGALPVGRQSMSYKVNDSYDDGVNAPQTAACGDSLDLSSAKSGRALNPPGIFVRAVSNGTALVFSLGTGALPPFADIDDPAQWILGARCHEVNNYDLWLPGGDGSFQTKADDTFFSYRSVPVPIHTLVTAQSLVIGASGPRAGAGPVPNCGIPAGQGTTCTQEGSWAGKLLLERVRQ
jgi:hypothetical protein